MSSLHSKQFDFQIHDFRGYYAFTVVTARLLAHHPYSGFVNRLLTVRFLPACCLSYGVLTFSPAGLLSSCCTFPPYLDVLKFGVPKALPKGRTQKICRTKVRRFQVFPGAPAWVASRRKRPFFSRRRDTILRRRMIVSRGRKHHLPCDDPQISAFPRRAQKGVHRRSQETPSSSALQRLSQGAIGLMWYT